MDQYGFVSEVTLLVCENYLAQTVHVEDLNKIHVKMISTQSATAMKLKGFFRQLFHPKLKFRP